MIVNTTWLTYVFTIVVLYYTVLFLASWLPSRYRVKNIKSSSPFFIIVIPAHNEELVIGTTIKNLLELKGERFLILVVNDGSTDQTSKIARRFKSTGKVSVIDRDSSIAGQGKGEVLNHAHRAICEQLSRSSSRRTSLEEKLPARIQSHDIIVGVLDADGWLDSSALMAVVPYFADHEVGAVQLPVKIWNYKESLLTRMQDIEFVGFSLFVQSGRDLLGSIGLGGNGQFVRLSALQSLGNSPWSRCLTEDLEIGLRLALKGWNLRFCKESFVAQQGLLKWRDLLRQRTRWIQGHYSCWKYFATLCRTEKVKTYTRFDLMVYLGLVAFVLLVGLNAALSILGAFGFIMIENNAFAFIQSPMLYSIFLLLLSVGPICLFFITYLRFGRRHLSLWTIPAFIIIFAIYTYIWVPCSIRALWNIATGQARWIKTPRSLSPDIKSRTA